MSVAPQAIEIAADDEIAADERFDFSARVDELRCHPNEVLRERLTRVRQQQARWRLEEVAITRVLDERDALGEMPDATVSARTARTNLEAARELESLPEIAAAAHAGELTWDQIQPLVHLATPDTDGEWAQRAKRMAPGDLDRMARRLQTVTAKDAERRHDARELRTWRTPEAGMSHGRWSLPDVHGVLVERVLEHMAERMRPPKGGKWDSLAHRKADALVELVTRYADLETTGRFRIEIVNIHDPGAKTIGASIDGIPLAQETVAALLPRAKVRECVTDENGVARTVVKPRQALPKDIERHIRRRDLTCRTPGCETTGRLEIHHTEPIAIHGESWDVHRLAAVCATCHSLYEPHGPYRLVGDAEDPDGLELVHRDDLPRDGPDP